MPNRFDQSERIRRLAAETFGIYCRDADGSGGCGGSKRVDCAAGWEPCVCKIRFMLLSGYIRACIPERSWEYTMDKVEPKLRAENAESLALIDAFMTGIVENCAEGTGLYLSGAHRSGITTLGHIILKTAVDSGIPAYATTMNDLTDLLKGTIDSDAVEEHVTRVRDAVRIVMIDDIDQSYLSNPDGWTSHQLISFFNRLHDQRCSLIVTARVQRGNLYQKLPESVCSKVMSLVPVPIKGSLFMHRGTEDKAREIFAIAAKKKVLVRKGRRA